MPTPTSRTFAPAGILREVIAGSKLVLMDEPFSALHHENRSFLRTKIQDIWRKLKLTIIFVSHDVNESLQLGDRVVVLGSGKIKKEIEIKFPRPRTEEVVYSNKFHKLKNEIS